MDYQNFSNDLLFLQFNHVLFCRYLFSFINFSRLKVLVSMGVPVAIF